MRKLSEPAVSTRRGGKWQHVLKSYSFNAGEKKLEQARD